MKSMDDAFCQQLQAAERNHLETLQNLTREKQQEIDQANQRVSGFLFQKKIDFRKKLKYACAHAFPFQV